VANLCCAGLVTRRVTFEVSTHVSSSAKLAWRNDHQKTPDRTRPAEADWAFTNRRADPPQVIK